MVTTCFSLKCSPSLRLRPCGILCAHSQEAQQPLWGLPERLGLLIGSFLLLLEIPQIFFHAFQFILLGFKFHC